MNPRDLKDYLVANFETITADRVVTGAWTIKLVTKGLSDTYISIDTSYDSFTLMVEPSTSFGSLSKTEYQGITTYFIRRIKLLESLAAEAVAEIKRQEAAILVKQQALIAGPIAELSKSYSAEFTPCSSGDYVFMNYMGSNLLVTLPQETVGLAIGGEYRRIPISILMNFMQQLAAYNLIAGE